MELEYENAALKREINRKDFEHRMEMQNKEIGFKIILKKKDLYFKNELAKFHDAEIRHMSQISSKRNISIFISFNISFVYYL